jgi:SpoVK/Ycf46/Vps4 family AAA+-type ATPase
LPSERPGWLIIKGYQSDDTVFIGRFYSEDQYRRFTKEKNEYERVKLERASHRLQEEEKRRSSTEETSSSIDRSAEACYKLANEHYEHGDFLKAVELYSEAIENTGEDDPDLYKRIYNRGLALCCLERYTEGKQDILKVLELKPNFAEGWYILGLAKEYLNDLDSAKEAYEKALSLNPDFKDAQNRKELLMSKKRKHHSSLISKASSSKGDSSEHATTLEQIKTLMKEGNLEEALKLAEGTLRQDPDDFQLLLHRRVIIGQIIAHSKPDKLCGLADVRKVINRLIVSKIKNWDHPLYRAEIAQTSVGVILHGPPGCGKTAIIFSAAKEAGIMVVEVVMSEILNLWSGESEKRLCELFETAKEAARSGKFVIILVDELDSLGLARSVTIDAGESSWSRDLRNTFRRLFNDIQGIPNLAVVGLTNCVWAVDIALRRPGRLGAGIIYVSPPDTKTREEIFRLYSQETPGHETLNFEKLAKITQWFSGDDIRNVCRNVHLEVAEKTIQTGNKGVIAMMDDYERFIQETVPTALGWIQDVSKAWIEGRIEDREIDKRLMADIKAAYPGFEREKTAEKEFRDHGPSYVK